MPYGGRFEGREAILGFFADWRGSYSGLAFEAEEIRDLGNGITFDVIVQGGRPLGSSGVVQLRYASVTEWVDGLIVSNTTYTDVDAARAETEAGRLDPTGPGRAAKAELQQKRAALKG